MQGEDWAQPRVGACWSRQAKTSQAKLSEGNWPINAALCGHLGRPNWQFNGKKTLWIEFIVKSRVSIVGNTHRERERARGERERERKVNALSAACSTFASGLCVACQRQQQTATCDSCCYYRSRLESRQSANLSLIIYPTRRLSTWHNYRLHRNPTESGST